MAKGESERSYFPGLMPGETRAWRRWLETYELDFDKFDYNVRIGPGIDAPPETLADMPELQEKLRKQFYESTRHRIDCVGYRGPAVTIFEVEVRGGVTALGQLKTYAELWRTTRPVHGPLFLRLVAFRLSPGMAEVFAREGIRADLVFERRAQPGAE